MSARAQYILIPIPDIDLLILLPEYFQKILDFKELMNTEQIELEQLWARIEQLWLNLYIQTADIPTLEYYEDMLGLFPEPGDSIEIRRWRILSRFRRRTPFTLPMMYEVLNSLVGIGNYTVNIDVSNYIITFGFIDVEQDLVDEAIKVMIQSLPAHLGQIYTIVTQPESIATIRIGATHAIGWSYRLPNTSS